ncbi:MAG TPA: HEAT repeat domain-containing protein, partial [Longimicrobiales bacterium]|nr:HEAT repeat domain-containing protein [Longimicrobiales bacterium]
SALFWVGQEAAEAATDGLAEVALGDDEAQDVRDAAVFALSQRPSDEGVPVLMELARTAQETRTRRTAFFWLAQSDDPRVVPFFEEILLGRPGGGGR